MNLRSLLPRVHPASIVLAVILLAAVFLRFYHLDSFPPGVQHDEVFVSDFAQTILNGQFPIFFELNRGNEPLFMYFVAAAYKLFGISVWTLRGTAALVGCAALGLTYLLVRDLFSDGDADIGQTGALVALLTAAGLTFSFWLLFESRVGLHSISTYLLAAATFYAFWRGWTRGARLWLLASGVLAGLAAYTYRPGIFVPAALALFVLYTLIFHRARWKNNLWLVPLIFLLAALTYLPLGYYIFTHPDSALARLGDLSAVIDALHAGNPRPLLLNALGTLGMFGIQGDPAWRYNVAFRPVFDPAWGLLFYAGLLLALWRFKKPGYALVLIWLGVMILPTVLSPDNPSQHRSVGAIGAAYVMPALALVAVGQWLQTRWPRAGRTAFGVVAAGLVLLAAFEGIRDYFFTWPANDQVRAIYRADLAEAAHWLDANDRGERVLISADFANDLDRGAFDLEAARAHDVHFFAGADTFVIPDAPSALYINPETGPIAANLFAKYRADMQPVYAVRGAGNTTELEIYRASGTTLAQWRALSPAATPATLANGAAEIVQAELPSSLNAGATLRARLWWRVLAPHYTDADALTWRAVLTDGQDYVWNETAGLGYTPSQWQPNDLVLSTFDLNVPADAPPHLYRVQVALDSKTGLQPFTSGTRVDNDRAIALDSVQVTRGPVPTSKPDLPVRYPSKVKFGDAVQLLGTDAVGEVAAGGTWRLALFWQVNRTIPSDYEIRLDAIGAAGNLIARREETLLGPDYPTHLWRAGEYLRSIEDLKIPSAAPQGKAVVRVFLLDPNGKPVGRAEGAPVAGIDIEGRPHTFTPPTPSHPRAARLGDNIEFLGYDLASNVIRPAEPIVITLYWHARGPTNKPYTVFVHVLNAAGQVIGQKDSPPLDGAASTNTWLAGEFLTDSYQFTVAAAAGAGAASFEIGLYDPVTGARLPVLDSNGHPIGDHLTIEGLTLQK
jgi:4-amino-4-deoxy-L-arabinose transferase-like glycosyltransferase